MPQSELLPTIGTILANAEPTASRAHAALEPLVRAHAPALAVMSSFQASLHPALELSSDLGFDAIAFAELAVAIEDTFGIDLDIADLDGCRTIRDLDSLIAAANA
jgi:acyl carrier protein